MCFEIKFIPVTGVDFDNRINLAVEAFAVIEL